MPENTFVPTEFISRRLHEKKLKKIITIIK